MLVLILQLENDLVLLPPGAHLNSTFVFVSYSGTQPRVQDITSVNTTQSSMWYSNVCADLSTT